MKMTFIGGGNMGEAMLAAVLEKGLAGPEDIGVAELSPERQDYLAERYGVKVTGDSRDVASGADVVVLAVKPQSMADVYQDLAGSLQPEQLVLSIVAGVRIDAICRGLGHRRVVRVMPNTPAQVGEGMSGWTATAEVSAEQKALARSVLGAMGREIYFTDEEHIDMVTAVSGSGPAYFFLFAECLADAAVEIGLSREDAEALVEQTMLGAARLVAESGETPAELRHKVTSKGGTTERALRVFEENGLADIARKAVAAACRRARELGG
jgi:pyrroline-5-carboxylate reductase